MRVIAILAFLVASLGAPSEAPGQQVRCGVTESVLAMLRLQFGETVIIGGVIEDGNEMRLLVSPAGTWTVVITVPAGFACMLASGSSFRFIDAPPDKGL